jgi:hypothetical protein
MQEVEHALEAAARSIVRTGAGVAGCHLTDGPAHFIVGRGSLAAADTSGRASVHRISGTAHLG